MKERLIAHRGEPESRPENSLEGFRQVLEAGAHYLETDVQLTADRVPVLCHDPTLLRQSGLDIEVTRTRYAGIRDVPAGQPEMFGAQYHDYRIARLEELVHLLGHWPAARAFVEIKQDSLDAFSIPDVVDRVLDTLAPAVEQCILISFDSATLAHARATSSIAIGWVLGEWSADSHAQADRLAPDYLFVSRKRLPPIPEPLWQGPWQWVLYTVNVQAELAPYLHRGFDLIETNAFRRLLAESFGHGILHD
jgi:glycerophosphoryl diester phosphodiesterase